MATNIVAASLVAAFAFFCAYWTGLIDHEAFQVLALTLASIVIVAVAAVILICIPDYLNGRHRSKARGRGHRERGRTRSRDNNNYSQRRSPSRSREPTNPDDCKSLHSVSTAEKSLSTISSMSTSRHKSPSMPPLPTRSRENNNNSSNGNNNGNNNNGNGNSNSDNTCNNRVITNMPPSQRSRTKRRHSLPPCLPSQSSRSQPFLNPIAERKLEDLMDFDDYWWRELDSRTQYYALILGYTEGTWDEDLSLDDLPCEDWDWEEMTNEQKAAAQHFGYTQDNWEDT